jgi:RecB family exonuclease
MVSHSVWSLRQWAEAIVELQVGALPARTVVVPRLRVAHALKRELAAFAPKALVGTTFVTPALAAREVLALAGVEVETGEEARRPVRLQKWFDQKPALRHFDVDVLREARGWADAFSRTLGELEAAGLTAADLRRHGSAQLDDLALAMEVLSRAAGPSVTNDALLHRATEVLSAGGAWPWAGQTLAVVSGHESGAQARLLRAIPRVTLKSLAARPVARRWVERASRLFPALDFSPGPAAPSFEHGAQAGTELDLLKRFLFSDPQVLADPARERSKGRDGSVELEEHSGVDAELEATADWVTRQVKAGRPLERLAVLVPHAEPLVSLVRSRLQRIPWPDGQLPVFVAGGEAAITTGTGARVLALLRALGTWLPSAAVAELLPVLATTDDERVSRDDAVGLVSSLGTLGGSPGRREGALDWLPAAKSAQARLDLQLERLAALEGRAEEESEVRRLRHLRRQRDVLARLQPALDGLHRLADLVVSDAPLSRLWPALADFLLSSKLLRLPVESVEIAHSLKAAMEQADLEDVRGPEALALIEELLCRLRRTTGRFGEPRLYVGTVRGAVGLGFDAVRIIGLAEGSIPPALREDAVLDSAHREQLGAPALATRDLRALSEVQAVFRVVVEASQHVTFSFPRADLAGSVHESSSLFIEVAAALGRPNAATHEPGPLVPRASELARDAFAPARSAQRDARLAQPIGEGAWLDRTAHLRKDVPPHWATTPACDPERVEATVRTERGALDGYLGGAAAALPMRGLTEALPISASRLKTLLECPHRYLLENVLYWGEPASAQQTGAFDALTYGTLVHAVLERFAREHGKDVAKGAEATLKAALQEIADEEFDRLLERYALLGEQVREVERRRMHRDLAVFFEADWEARKKRKLLAVEKAFAAELAVERESFFVHGFVDRLDRVGKTTLVRDYKTGRPHPRKGADLGPRPELDAQIALYGLVARELAGEWELPGDDIHVAYAYASAHEPLRAFDEDAEVLFEAGEKWLKVARTLLASRTFPRRPTVEACTFCAFKVVCGSAGPARSDRWLSQPEGPAEQLLAELWGTTAEEEEE